MGPKRSENTGKTTRLAQNLAGSSNFNAAGTINEQENQICVGKFAADLELCCRESTPPYPIPIPVQIRGHPPASAQYASTAQLSQMIPNAQSGQQQQQQQQTTYAATHSGTPVTPSFAGANLLDDQLSSMGKKTSRARIPSVAGLSGTALGMNPNDYDGRSFSIPVPESSKVSSFYQTFYLLRDSEFFRPKLLVETSTNDPESIDQITVLFMRSWQLDQRFIDILKRVLPLQDQLHTLNLTFVGLNDQTIHGVVDLCQITKNLKNLILDGNPLASSFFHLFIDKEDSKIVHLSLRFCEMNDSGAENLASALGNLQKQNWKLLNLILTGNQIGNRGAKALATALRYNRTLISLNLSSNLISDEGAFHIALVLRRIILTTEETIYRRFLIGKRYAETHPDDPRNHMISPTPSNVSSKSKSGRDSRLDAKRLAEAKNRKTNSKTTSQTLPDKRNRAESDENRPTTPSKTDGKRNKTDASGTRTTNLNTSTSVAAARRTPTNPPATTTGKDSETNRTNVGQGRVKKVAAAVNATSKKNIAAVKEENENQNEDGLVSQLAKKDRDNPLLETNEVESHDGQIWLKGNYALLNLNLSRNHLTTDSVKEFLLTLQQQTTLTQLTDALASSAPTTTAALIDFSGLCRLELKGMTEISVRTAEYQSLETLLLQKNPMNRLKKYREREAKDALDQQTTNPNQLTTTIGTAAEKTTIVPERARIGSSVKGKEPRPSSRVKE